MSNKNKFTNAFASALNKSPEIETQTSESSNIQTSKHLNVQTSENLELKPVQNETKKPSKTKKKSLKELGWIPTTIYLPKKIKDKLKISSTKQDKDMSEIVMNLIEANL